MKNSDPGQDPCKTGIQHELSSGHTDPNQACVVGFVRKITENHKLRGRHIDLNESPAVGFITGKDLTGNHEFSSSHTYPNERCAVGTIYQW